MEYANLSPKMQARYNKIIEVAAVEFISNGYGRTNVSKIISVCGGSLSTIYALFGNKEGLFRHVIARGVEKFEEEIRAKIDIEAETDLRSFLTKFGEAYLNLCLNERIIKFKKLMISETFEEDKKSVEIFFEIGGRLILGFLERFFGKKELEGRFKSKRLDILAVRFCMLLEEPHTRFALVNGIFPSWSEEEKSAWVEDCVEFFMHGAVYSESTEQRVEIEEVNFAIL